jgi:hypothetical protein
VLLAVRPSFYIALRDNSLEKNACQVHYWSSP